MNTFKKYLDQRGETPNAFAKRTGMSQPTVWRLYSGKTKFVSPRIAKDIEMYTNGEIKKESLIGWPEE